MAAFSMSCREAVETVGDRFQKGEYFLPELMMAGNMLSNISSVVKPKLVGRSERKRHGKVLMGTVKWDIHDIGKNIVSTLMALNGFEVRDMGVDVPIDRIISEAKEFGAQIIGLSGLLTLAFDPMKNVVERLEQEGIRDTVKVIIGGGQMDDQICRYVGADAFVTDAVAGISLCKSWLN